MCCLVCDGVRVIVVRGCLCSCSRGLVCVRVCVCVAVLV